MVRNTVRNHTTKEKRTEKRTRKKTTYTRPLEQAPHEKYGFRITSEQNPTRSTSGVRSITPEKAFKRHVREEKRYFWWVRGVNNPTTAHFGILFWTVTWLVLFFGWSWTNGSIKEPQPPETLTIWWGRSLTVWKEASYGWVFLYSGFLAPIVAPVNRVIHEESRRAWSAYYETIEKHEGSLLLSLRQTTNPQLFDWESLMDPEKRNERERWWSEDHIMRARKENQANLSQEDRELRDKRRAYLTEELQVHQHALPYDTKSQYLALRELENLDRKHKIRSIDHIIQPKERAEPPFLIKLFHAITKTTPSEYFVYRDTLWLLFWVAVAGVTIPTMYEPLVFDPVAPPTTAWSLIVIIVTSITLCFVTMLHAIAGWKFEQTVRLYFYCIPHKIKRFRRFIHRLRRRKNNT